VSRADVDHDAHLSRDELLGYVIKNVQNHLREGRQLNAQVFATIDTDHDGRTTRTDIASADVALVALLRQSDVERIRRVVHEISPDQFEPVERKRLLRVHR
jgi:hypothetical protein